MTFESSWVMRGVYPRARPLCAASLPTDHRGLSTWVDRYGAYRVAPGVGSVEGLLRRVPEPGVLRRELPDRRPVERLATVSEQRQEPIAEQARQRHRHAKSFRRGEGEPDVLLSQGCGKAGGLEPPLGDLPSIGLVEGRGEERDVGGRREERAAERSACVPTGRQ